MRREEVAMLEEYFVKPYTVDRIRASWIGPQIEQLRDLAGRSGLRRQVHLAARAAAGRLRRVRPSAGRAVARPPAGPRRCLRGQAGRRVPRCSPRDRPDPGEGDARSGRADARARASPASRAPAARITPTRSPAPVPGFFDYLDDPSVACAPRRSTCYRHHLDRFEAYLQRVGVAGPSASSRRRSSAPSSPSAPAPAWQRRTVRESCGSAARVPALRAPRRAWSAAI